MSDDPKSIPEQGRLTDTSLPRILMALLRARFDGSLELCRGRTRKLFTFDTGSPVQAESNLASEGLVLQLEAQGVLGESEHTRVQAYAAQKRCSESVALLGLKLLEPKALIAALKDQLRRRLLDCFGWPDGEYRLLPSTTTSAEHAGSFRSDPLAIAQEGIEVHWSPERILADLAEHLTEYPQLRQQAAGQARRLRHDAHSERLIASLNGEQSLSQTLASASGSTRALAAAWVLDASGALAWSPQPIRSEGQAGPQRFDSEIEIHVSQRNEPADGEEKSPAASQAAGAPDERGAALRAEILEKLDALAELDHYEILGITADAGPAQIKKAYFKAAKHYHPDALARLGLVGLRAEADQVFAGISEAFEVLSDDRKRADYDASLRDHGPAIDTHRLARAETAYRKGEILTRMGDFRGALQYLQSAVELWPEEFAYQLALGWALHKKSPADPAAARIHLEKAVALEPGNAIACFRLSVVLRTLGEEAAATRMAAVARRLDPTVAAG